MEIESCNYRTKINLSKQTAFISVLSALIASTTACITTYKNTTEKQIITIQTSTKRIVFGPH